MKGNISGEKLGPMPLIIRVPLVSDEGSSIP
jgi:hypothetical protein